MKAEDIAELMKNAEFMRQKLEEAREKMERAPITLKYDNGGGQKGTRENPIFPAYEKLLKSYQAILTQLEGAGVKTESLRSAKIVDLQRGTKWARRA